MIQKLSVLCGRRSSLVLVLSVFALPAAAHAAPDDEAEVGAEAGVAVEAKAQPTEGPSAEAAGTATSQGPTVPAPAPASPSVALPSEPPSDLEEQEPPKPRWDFGVRGYFRAPVALGISNRVNPDNPNGPAQQQISYGPKRTVDANY